MAATIVIINGIKNRYQKYKWCINGVTGTNEEFRSYTFRHLSYEQKYRYKSAVWNVFPINHNINQNIDPKSMPKQY